MRDGDRRRRSTVFVVEPDDSRSRRSTAGRRRRAAGRARSRSADGDRTPGRGRRARCAAPHQTLGLLRPRRRAAVDRTSSTSAPRRWPTSSPSGSTPPCSSTTCARSRPPRSATGSPARCTTASPRRSSASATSSTRSSRSATTRRPASSPSTLRAEITRLVSEIRFSIFDLRHEVDRRAALRRAGRLRPRGQPRHRTSASTCPSTSPVRRCRRGPRPRCCGSRRRPSATCASTRAPTTCGSPSTPTAPTLQPRGRGRRRRQRRARASTTGACRPCASVPSASAPTSTSSPRPDGGTVVSLRSRRRPHPTKERPPMSTTVLLVDDHELIRQGLARAFERDDDMTVVGQAGSVAEGVVGLADAPSPTSSSPTSSCPTARPRRGPRDPRRRATRTGVVVLTMHAGDDQIFAAMEAGASAFVGKDTRAAEVVSAAKHAAVAPRTLPVRRAEPGRDAPSDVARTAQAVRPRGRRCWRCSPTASGTGEIAAHALHERVHGEDPHHAHLPEARRRQPRAGAGHRHAAWACSTTPRPQRF